MKQESFIESIYDSEIVGFEEKGSRIYKLKNTKKVPADSLTDDVYFENYMSLLSKKSIIGSKYPSFGFLWRDDFFTRASVAIDHPYAFKFENFDLSEDKDKIEKNEDVLLCNKELEISNYESLALKRCINSVVAVNSKNKDIAPKIVDEYWKNILIAYLKEKPFA